MRVTAQPAQRRRLGSRDQIVLAVSLIAALKGIALLQASKSEIEAATTRLAGVLGDGQLSGGGSGGLHEQHLDSRGSDSQLADSVDSEVQDEADIGADGKQQRDAACRRGPHRREFSIKELALQQERYAAWQRGELHGLAMCLAVKDQAEDLPEWLEYHLALGAGHVYVFDTGSRPPVKWALSRFREAGTVTYRYITDFVAAAQDLNTTNDHKYTPKFKQWIVYSLCLRDYGKRHRFMAFIDSDEFLVITDGTRDLPAMLAQYEQYGGLVANWRILGSSGHKEHQESTLEAYTSCYPEQVPEQLAVKSIVNTALTVQPASPHNAFYVGGCYAVSTAGERVDGFSSKRIRSERLVVYHYVTKSLQDFEGKMQRGGGLGVNFRDMHYWEKVQSQSTETCTVAADAWRGLRGAAGQHPQRHLWAVAGKRHGARAGARHNASDPLR